MVRPELLEILICPENHTRLRAAEPELVERLNRSIADGTLTNRGGRKVESPLTEALVREDGAVVYPVVDDIPVMLVDEAIEVNEQ